MLGSANKVCRSMKGEPSRVANLLRLFAFPSTQLRGSAGLDGRSVAEPQSRFGVLARRASLGSEAVSHPNLDSAASGFWLRCSRCRGLDRDRETWRNSNAFFFHDTRSVREVQSNNMKDPFGEAVSGGYAGFALARPAMLFARK